MNSLKKMVTSAGLAGLLAAGTVAFTAGSASALTNDLYRTVVSPTPDDARHTCWVEANGLNTADNNGYYYCADGGSTYVNGQLRYVENLWWQH